jgi:L-2-hydroxycarboxylate dehydrogenase (NAD+)
MRLRAEQERALIVGMLTTLGAGTAEAASVAEVTTEADLRGYPSQGLMRFPMLVKRTRSGAIRTRTTPEVVQETDATAVMDGLGGYGQHVGIQAMDLAIRKAKEVGLGAVAVRNANHVGMCGYYAERAAKKGCFGVATSTTEAIVHPYGGLEPFLGTNPIAIAFPTLGDPFILDMATSAMSMGRIMEAAQEGRKLPEGCALDTSGKPTTDPTEALRGVLSPMAGPKGYGLGLFVAALAALSGAALGRDVVGTITVDPPANKGDFYLAIDVEAFRPLEEFTEQIGEYFTEFKGSAAAPGFSEVLIPGERSIRSRARNLELGYEVYDDLWAELLDLGRSIGFDVPSVLV